MSRKQRKFKRPEYSRMYAVLKARLAEHIWKLILTIFLFNVLISFLITTGLFPAMILNGRLLYAGYALSAVFTFLMLTVIFSVACGIISQCTDAMLGRGSLRPRLFSAFSESSDRMFRASVFFSAVASAVAVISAAVIFFFKEPALAEFSRMIPAILGSESPDEETAAALKSLFLAFSYCIVFLAVFAFSFVPFIFVWNALLEDRKLRFSGALKKSLLIVRGRYFHYIGFVIFSCMKNILMLAAVSAFHFAVSQWNRGAAGFASVVLGFFAFMQYYTVLSKMYCCVPVYYFSFLSVNGLIGTGGNASREEADSAAGQENGG
ncbi:MAG: hypothetical protein J6K96_02120 [Treponema sp.]|nr:hypothetical protein [Treponema sp.]